MVIAAGGGGVPVMRGSDGTLSGVDAVIDKDRASALLANLIGADELCILTGVEKVAINYKKPDQKTTSIASDCRGLRALPRRRAVPEGLDGPQNRGGLRFYQARRAQKGHYYEPRMRGRCDRWQSRHGHQGIG